MHHFLLSLSSFSYCQYCDKFIPVRDLPGREFFSHTKGLSKGMLYGAPSSLSSTSTRSTLPRSVDLMNTRVCFTLKTSSSPRLVAFDFSRMKNLQGLHDHNHVCLNKVYCQVAPNHLSLLDFESQLHLLVLRVAKLAEWVTSSTAIANKDVEVAVVAKQQLSTVVIGRWLYHFQDGSGDKASLCLNKFHHLATFTGHKFPHGEPLTFPRSGPAGCRRKVTA